VCVIEKYEVNKRRMVKAGVTEDVNKRIQGG